MISFTRTLLGATAIIALAAGTATAQDADKHDRETIDQVQLGDLWSNVNVYVPTSKSNVISSSAAVGNAATAIVESGDLSVEVNQTLKGAVAANTSVWAGNIDGDVISSTSATGNSVYAGNWYGNADVDTDQLATKDVTATSHVDVENTWAVSTQSTAVANTASFETDFSDQAESFNKQTSSGNVFASSTADVVYVEGFVQNSAIAAGNSTDVAFGEVYDAFAGAVQTTDKDTTIVSSAQTYADDAADIFTTSAAVGNQFNGSQLDSGADFGSKGSEVFQGNGAEITANADTVVLDHFHGVASTSATGVGNSFAVSGLGGETNAHVIQTNFGAVNSDVTLNSNDFNGGTILANATSIGNSFSSVAQESSQRGGVQQTNFSNVSARSFVRTSNNPAGDVVATSTAIGNSATFENRANNNGRRGD